MRKNEHLVSGKSNYETKQVQCESGQNYQILHIKIKLIYSLRFYNVVTIHDVSMGANGESKISIIQEVFWNKCVETLI